MFASGAVQVPTGAVHCSMAEGFSGFLRHSDALWDSEHGVFRVVSFRLRSLGHWALCLNRKSGWLVRRLKALKSPWLEMRHTLRPLSPL